MDPNEVLNRMREARLCIVKRAEYAELHECDPGWSYTRMEERNALDREVIADCASALDGWLSKGGYLPSEWNRNRS